MPISDHEDGALEAKYDAFMSIREVVLKALETARTEKIIGKSLNAKLTLYPKGAVATLLSSLHVDLSQIFIVSQLEVLTSGTGRMGSEELTIDVQAATGDTCDRCWQVVHETHDGLCDRCANIVTH